MNQTLRADKNFITGVNIAHGSMQLCSPASAGMTGKVTSTVSNPLFFLVVVMFYP